MDICKDDGLRKVEVINRAFLFLQGPHGPFFRQLAMQLKSDGFKVMKVGFNLSDEKEWGAADAYFAYHGNLKDWPDWIINFIAANCITDLVIYGDVREYHRIASSVARTANVVVHNVEEGYLRPRWITYERFGVNGYSRLTRIPISKMRLAKHIGSIEMRAEPANWGNSWHHIANSLIYYSGAFRSKKTYPNYTINSYTNVTEAALFYIRRLAQLPIKIPLSFLREWRLLQSRQKYDLVLLQLSFDSSMYEHSNYKRISDFIEDAIAGFSEGAPKDHALVFKTHPFEDGRDKLQKVCRIIARSHGIAERVIFIDGGNLGLLLDNARSVVTINSTAAQQALWRGLPVRAMGRSVYGKSELVSNQNLADFFRMPIPPDRKAYEIYRKFLLATSQVEGGFYSESARALALGRLPTLMCAPLDPYDTAFSKN